MRYIACLLFFFSLSADAVRAAPLARCSKESTGLLRWPRSSNDQCRAQSSGQLSDEAAQWTSENKINVLLKK